jgi:calcyphosin
MNEKRLAVVKHAWQSLDESGSGKIAWGKLQTAYRAEDHPRVKTREKKSETARAEFVETMSKREQGGYVTEEGFF